MQGPTHILAGVIINRLFKWRNYQPVGLALAFVFCLFIDGLFYKLALITYHPPKPDITDPFWLIYEIAMCLVALVLIYVFWRDYKWGIIFVLLPYADWIFIYTQKLLGFSIPLYQRPWIHEGLSYVFDNTVPFNYLNYLPDNRQNPLACIWEILIFGGLVLLLRYLLTYRKNIHFKK